MRLQSAWELSGVFWGHDLAVSLLQYNASGPGDHDSKNTEHVIFEQKLMNALRSIWKHAPIDVFDNA